MLTGPYLVHVAGVPAIVLGVIGCVASLGYSIGRYSMNRLGITDPLFFIMFGIVAVAGAYYVQAAPAFSAPLPWLIVPQALPFSAFVLGLPVGGLITNVLLIDEIRDWRFDGQKGWRTGSVRFGISFARWELIGLTAFAYVVPFWFWLGLGFSPWVLLTLATLPEAVAVAREGLRHRRDGPAAADVAPRPRGCASTMRSCSASESPFSRRERLPTAAPRERSKPVCHRGLGRVCRPGCACAAILCVTLACSRGLVPTDRLGVTKKKWRGLCAVVDLVCLSYSPRWYLPIRDRTPGLRPAPSICRSIPAKILLRHKVLAQCVSGAAGCKCVSCYGFGGGVYTYCNACSLQFRTDVLRARP